MRGQSRSLAGLVGLLFTLLALAGCAGAGSTSTIAVSKLPPQADTTLHLIAKGGPFPFSHDGIVFGNYEHVLPNEPYGYYHEYTVITPGAPTRGARRIITAQDGTDYYTSDHYASFEAITGVKR